MQQKTLTSLYAQHKGKLSDKWPSYLTEYDRLLKEYQSLPINLLEIGIQNGGSLEIWSKYFDHAVHIIGCDINERCKELQFTDKRISVVVGDANSQKSQRMIAKISSSFDIVLDDGSHKSSDIVRSFARYFPKLTLGGIFIAEDLHCSYWEAYEGGLFDARSSISFFKRLADVINHEHWGIEQPREWLMQGFEKTYGIKLSNALLSQIHSIEFTNSLCVIRKRPATENILGKRIIVGEQAAVVPGLNALDGNSSEAMDQSQNNWSNRKVLPEDELIARIAQTAKLAEELEETRSQLAVRERLIDQQRELIEQQNHFISSQNEQINVEKSQNALELQGLREASHAIEQNMHGMHSALAERDHRLAAMYASTSWQVTKPLRFFGHQVKRARFVAHAMPQLIAKNGGIKNSSFKAARVLRTKGWSGLRDAWRNANRPPLRGDLAYLADGTTVGINDYSEWLKRYGQINSVTQMHILNQIRMMETKPLISIIMPIYNPNIQWLDEAIESLRNQFYENWQLCLADDRSTKPDVKDALERYSELDDRIRVVYREKNGHISEASNSAIDIATGDWLALMDQDDLLPNEALYCVVKAINAHPDAGLIYSDEDKIDENGVRFAPYFKSDWNPDLFLSQNMISHLGAYRADLVRSAGGFRSEFVGSQDYDLALRITELLQPEQIVHIPRVLYHWRSHSDSTAQAGSNKNYAITAGQRALDAHFQRKKIDASAELLDIGMYRTRYKLPEQPPLVSLIIPTRNGLSLIRQCITSILEKTTYRNFEIIIIDNNSDDPEALSYFKKLADHPQISVIRDERPFNYSALNNNAVKQAKGELIGLINNDIEVITPEWLDEMVVLALQPGVGAVGACLWYPNDTLQHGGVIIGAGGVAGHAHSKLIRGHAGYFGRARLTQTLSAVTAACLIVRKSIYTEVRGLNERDLKVAFNDVDFCLKIRAAGYRNVWTPFSELYHHESATRGYEDTPEKRKRFESEIRYMIDTWQTNQWLDPAYSPNLDIHRDDYSLAWPPRVAGDWWL